MGRARCFIFLFFIILFSPGFAFSADPSIFSGKWEYVDNIGESEKPYSVFDLILSEDEKGDIRGSYCFVTQSGSRIDCDPESELNVHGSIEDSTGKATVNFNSSFGAKDGVAELSINADGTLVWDVVKQPQGGDYYGPIRVIFRKIPSEANAHTGEKSVVAEKAYLYDGPLTSGGRKLYVIKGDYVKLIGVSSDLKFWKIGFMEKNGKYIRKWIDCRDIDFCPR